MLALALVASLVTGTPSAQAAQMAQVGGGPQYVTALNGGRFLIPAGSEPDAIAYYKNGFRPVLVPSGKLTPSSLGSIATERGPDILVPNCLQPPAHLDLLNTSPQLLQKYGIAPRAGEPLSKWLAMESHVKHHVCSSYLTNDAPTKLLTNSGSGKGPFVSRELPSSIWAGKVDDQNCVSTTGNLSCDDGSHWYTETDTDYYINCPSVTSQIAANATMGEWAGLGGVGYYSELQQGGIAVDYSTYGAVVVVTLYAFYEWVGPWGTTSARYLNFLYGLDCGDHMYTKVYNGNCVVIINLTHNWTWSGCNGPAATTNTAELILERAGSNGVPYGSDTTFYGAGATDTYENPSYVTYGSQQHDYFNVYNPEVVASANKMLNTGPIQNDSGDPPYDQYTVNVVHPCGGYSSCS